MKDYKHTHMWVWRVRETTCPNCDGKGFIHGDGKEEMCKRCNGTGVVKYQYQVCEFCGITRDDYQGHSM